MSELLKEMKNDWKFLTIIFGGIALIALIIFPLTRTDLEEYRQEKYRKYEKVQVKEIYDSRENHSQCMTWALGDDWISVKMRNVPARWNERHGDLFKLYLDDDYAKGLMRMYEAWKEHKLK